MNDQEAHDLLIKIEANQNMYQQETSRRLSQIEGKLEKRMCHTHAEKIKKLEAYSETVLPCQTNTEKLKTHDKILFGAVLIAVASAVKSFLFSGSAN